MSLVADYSDSDSDEEKTTSTSHDDDIPSSKQQDKVKSAPANNFENKEKIDSCSEPQKFENNTLTITNTRHGSSSNFLLSSVADSGSSESEDDEVPKKRKTQAQMKLDNPFRTFGGSTNVSKEDSVFRNPFREKEDEKIAVLEHHVKMTDNPETSLTINGKKICWNYRKRKCYLGTQCPYAHDSDVPLTDEQLKEQKVEGDLHRSQAGGNVSNTGGGLKNSFNASNTKTHLPGTASIVAGGYDSSAFYSSPHLSGGHNKNNTSTSSSSDAELNVEQPYTKSKKRVGLSNSLIPPKKALNLYHKTKDT